MDEAAPAPPPAKGFCLPADELGLLWAVEVSDSSRVINSGGQEAHCKVMSDWRDWQQLKLLYEPSQGRLGLSIQRTMQTLLKTSWFCTGLSQVKARRVWDCREGLKLGSSCTACPSLGDFSFHVVDLEEADGKATEGKRHLETVLSLFFLTLFAVITPELW